MENFTFLVRSLDDVVFAVEIINFFFGKTLNIAFVYADRVSRDRRMTPFAQYT